MSDYLVIYERADDGGWGAYVPDVPGVVAVGATQDEVAELIREALGAYAEDLSSRGGELPVPTASAGTIQAA